MFRWQNERVTSRPEKNKRTAQEEIAAGESATNPIRRKLFEIRVWVDRHPRLRLAYLVGIAVLGVAVILAGIVMLVIPGPGWLTIFLGLAILGTEFHWARRLTGWTKERFRQVIEWWNARKARKESSSAKASKASKKR